MKKIFCVVLALVLVLGLAACGGGGNGPDATVKKFSDALKSFDTAKIKECLTGDLDVDDLEMDLGTGGDAVVKLMKDWYSKLKYKIGEIKTEGDSATVKADYTYVDASPVMKAALGEYLQKAMAAAFSGQEVDEEYMVKLLAECLESAQKNNKTGEANATVTFTLVKEAENWKIKDFSDEMANVATCNMLDALTDLFGGLFGE